MAFLDPLLFRNPGYQGPTDEERFDWATAKDPSGGTPVLVPHHLADLDFTRPAPPAWVMRKTNGLAGENTRAEPICSARAEMIERACSAELRMADGPDLAARRIDPESLARRIQNGEYDTPSMVFPVHEARIFWRSGIAHWPTPRNPAPLHLARNTSGRSGGAEPLQRIGSTKSIR